MQSFKFIKENNSWYIDLPEYIEKGGSKSDLQMVEGADTMLDMISEGNEEVSLVISETEFLNSTKLTLIEKCDPYVGGGYYLFPGWKGIEFNKQIWLCAVTEYVFGKIPETIFIAEMK